MDIFSRRLIGLRNEKDLSQREVAKLLGVHFSTYMKYENGGETNFTMLVKISDFFGVSTDYLLGKTNLPDPLN